ncbi:MAG: hypothetical protein EOP49_28060, partial [Sphingobacteriales bacterium]
FSQGVARLNADGSLDTTFADLTSYLISGTSLVLQSDQKIIVGSSSSYYDPVTSFTTYDVFRLNTDGTLDETFSAPQNSGGYVKAVALQQDGKVVIGGDFTTVGGQSRRGLCRLNSDGSLDSTFAPTTLSSGTVVNSVVVRPNNNILIGGSFTYITANDVAILLPGGGFDSTFSNPNNNLYNGVVMGYNSQFGVTRVLQQPDGKIVFCGDFGVSCTAYSSRNLGRVLGTDHYRMNGATRLDLESNGCDQDDNGFPFVKYKVVNGTNESHYYSNGDGFHTVELKNGTSVITPELFNPSWFSISPPNITVSMPSAENYYIQDFCVTPVGDHRDLEVSIIPLSAGTPGFLGRYKVIVANNGNQATSGSLTFNYDDTHSDYLDSFPSALAETNGQLVWLLEPLAPLTSTSFEVTLILNSPLSDSPLVLGDILESIATVSAAQGIDEVAANNVAELHQVMVSAQDPNDKTCVEGGSIAVNQVGDFVHYLIRFENLGTWPAQNVTVSDIIDTAKYDISTLTPLDGSHPFHTRISAGNKVEFLFENIYLDFQDDYNDGYVLFKIRTRPTLVVNDVFENKADIYFDYNLPVVTNTASTV